MGSKQTDKSFDTELQQVRDKMIIMAQMVSSELSDSVHAFAGRDLEEASDTVAIEDLINASERLIDEHIIKAIAYNQPMAVDCKKLIAALRIAKDLDRIGNYASSIAYHSITLDQLEITGEEQRLIDMGHAVQTMMEEVIEAYVEEDVGKAEIIRDQDNSIDELYTKIFEDLLIISTNNGKMASACTHLAFVGRSMERIGDHITNIAEEIIYSVQGKFPEQERIKADFSSEVKV